MFSGSSRQRDLINPDGSINIYCGVCGEFIARTTIRMGSATCELCRRILDGEELTAEQVRDYKLSKGNKTDVSMLIVPDLPPGDMAKFSFRSLGGNVLRAVGIKKEKKPAPQSLKVAKSKARGRLFEAVDLGTMDELNEKMKEGPK